MQLFKKNTIENIVPVLISLKHLLERNKSSLLKYLMIYFKELMKEYKEELNEILSADPQLASEIKFDMNRIKDFKSPDKTSNSPRLASTRKSVVVMATPLKNAKSPRIGYSQFNVPSIRKSIGTPVNIDKLKTAEKHLSSISRLNRTIGSAFKSPMHMKSSRRVSFAGTPISSKRSNGSTPSSSRRLSVSSNSLLLNDSENDPKSILDFGDEDQSPSRDKENNQNHNKVSRVVILESPFRKSKPSNWEIKDMDVSSVDFNESPEEKKKKKNKNNDKKRSTKQTTNPSKKSKKVLSEVESPVDNQFQKTTKSKRRKQK